MTLNYRQRKQLKLLAILVIIGVIVGTILTQARENATEQSAEKQAAPPAEPDEDDADSEEDTEVKEEMPKLADEIRKTTTTTTTTPKPPAPKEKSSDNKEQKLPYALMIGAHRCNLQYLTDVLKYHPKVLVRWGPDFFNSAERFEKGLGWYFDHLPEVPEDHILIERDPDYYASPDTAKRVYETAKDMKLIFMACDPTKRTVNHYRSRKAEDKNLGPMDSIAIDPINKNVISDHDFITQSLYSKHIKEWLKYFPQEQLFVLDDQTLSKDVNKEVKSLEEFLNLEPFMSEAEFYFNETRGTDCARLKSEKYCFGLDQRFRKARDKLPEPINRETINRLKDFFRGHNEDFYKTAGREFQWNK